MLSCRVQLAAAGPGGVATGSPLSGRSAFAGAGLTRQLARRGPPQQSVHDLSDEAPVSLNALDVIFVEVGVAQ